MVAHACDPSYTGSINRRLSVQASMGTNARPYAKNNRSKKDGQEWLKPGEHEALSSNPSAAKKRKRNPVTSLQFHSCPPFSSNTVLCPAIILCPFLPVPSQGAAASVVT
jgi:hypothetical protein